MPGFGYDLHGPLGDPEQEERWRTEQFAHAHARAERVRQLIRGRKLATEPATDENPDDSNATD